MNIFNLPDDIFPGSPELKESIILHNYSAKTGSFKGKSILHRNAISLVISGEKTMHFAEKTVHVQDDEFHFLSAGNCLASVDLSRQHIFQSVLLFFDNKVLADFYIKHHARIKQISGAEKVKSEPYISFKKDDFTRHYIQSLQLLIQKRGMISLDMKLLKFEELMLYLLEYEPHKLLSFRVTQGNEEEDLRIRKAVETNITSSLSLEELAFICNMSVSTFKRKFTKLYESTPGQWFLKQRMELAASLLEHHQEKPTEIYQKLGYENHSSFTQAFRQTYGMTPREFQLQKLNVYQ